MATIILTRPQGSGSGIPGTVISDISVPGLPSSPTNVVVVDQCPTITNVSIKWIYTLVDAIANKVVTAEVLATHRNGTNPSWNISGMIGDVQAMLHTTNVVIVGGNIGLQITNRTNNVIVCNVARIQILA